MRRIALFLALALLLTIPAPARAQSAVAFESLTIELWPDFDQPSVLVLYELVISGETPLPAQVNIRMPAGAQLFALARAEAQGLMNVEHAPPIQEGNYSVVSFVVNDQTTYRVEFYVPYIQREQQRAFIYAWPGDYEVAALKMLLQEPLAAENILTEPEMTSKETRGGFTYRLLTAQNLKAGERFALKVSYDNPRGELSVGRPQVTSPLEPSQPFLSFLPWILGGLGVALIVGGGAWYWLSGRSTSGTGRARNRHAASAEEEVSSASAYCSQCGKRAQPGDRFCRACGTKLRL